MQFESGVAADIIQVIQALVAFVAAWSSKSSGSFNSGYRHSASWTPVEVPEMSFWAEPPGLPSASLCDAADCHSCRVDPSRENKWMRVFFGVSALNFLRAAIPRARSIGGIRCERSGIINIGIEGMMLAGAFRVCCQIPPTTGALSKPGFSVIVSLGVGGLMGLLHGMLSIRFLDGPDHFRFGDHHPKPDSLPTFLTGMPLQMRFHHPDSPPFWNSCDWTCNVQQSSILILLCCLFWWFTFQSFIRWGWNPCRGWTP